MKKQLFISLIGLLFPLISAYANDGVFLMPSECSIENKNVYEPINEIHIRFKEAIDVVKDVQAFIYCGNEKMATGAITSYQYSGKTGKESYVIATFNNLILPKGKSYKLEIPADCIYSSSNPSVKNKELQIPFTVPAYITVDECTIKNGSTVASTDFIAFHFRTETEPLGSPTMTLYREGIPVRKVEAVVNWDWNIGQAYAKFETVMNFEKGINYSIVLPEGSLSPRFRTDITNEEAKVDFIGGYTKPIEPITYVWCSLFDSQTDVLNEILFYYDRAIMLSENPKIQLLSADNKLIKEVVPTLREENKKWIVACNFGGIKVPEGGCQIVIPEGTVISADGNVAVNSNNKLNVNVSTGINAAAADNIKIKTSDRKISISNAPTGKTLEIYSAEGKKIIQQPVTSNSITIELQSHGIYIVHINGISYKVTV